MEVKSIKKEKMKEFLDDFYNNAEKWYKKQMKEDFVFDEETQLEIIKNYTYDKNYNFIIRYINNPTKLVCMESIKKNGFIIKYISNPTEEMKLNAINQNGYNIQFIKNPTKEMCIQAIRQNGGAIEFIKNPTEEMCLEAIKNYRYSIRFIKNPTDEMKFMAIKKDSDAIQFIKNPTKEMCMQAIRQNGSSIKYIKNPTEEMQLIAIKGSEYAIQYIKKEDQSFEIVEYFFKNYKKDSIKSCYLFKYLSKKFITKDQALFMIQEDPNSINYIGRRFQREIIEMKPELKKYLKDDINNMDEDDYFE